MTATPIELATDVGTRLRERDEMIATAESATGGLVSSILTDIPGSSDYFNRGFVTYAYEAKTGTLGIDRAILDTQGAVSEQVATAMATSARDLAGTAWGLSVTGVAGPDGGSDAKPVGTMYIGVAYAAPWGSQESSVSARRYEFRGDRHSIKEQTAGQAISDLLTEIESRQ